MRKLCMEQEYADFLRFYKDATESSVRFLICKQVLVADIQKIYYNRRITFVLRVSQISNRINIKKGYQEMERKRGHNFSERIEKEFWKWGCETDNL